MPPDVRHAILSVFPHLAGAHFSVAGKGFHSLAVEAGGLLFKFPEGREAEAALRGEARMLAAVRPRVTMDVPEMTLHEVPRLFSSHPMLRGDTIDAAGYERLDEAARRRLAEDLSLFFAEIHAIPLSVAREAGAEPIALWDIWDVRDETLAPIWPLLPQPLARTCMAATADYRALSPDPFGEVYGFLDAHGWNMAFDHEAGRLRGIFDFADSGIGALHREFVHPALIDPQLTLDIVAVYETSTGRTLCRRRIFLLAAAQRLSELAGALEASDSSAFEHGLVIDWFDQASRFGWEAGGKELPG